MPRDPEAVGCDEVHHDIVIVSGIEGDVLPSRLGHRAQHIQGVVAVEGRELDGDHLGKLHEAAPEPIGQLPAADGRLQVEAEHRGDPGHLAAVVQQLLVAGLAQGGQVQQAGMVSQLLDESRFSHRLRGGAADAGDPQQGFRPVGVGPVHLFPGQLQDGSKQVVPGIADGKLGHVHTQGQTSRTGRDVIAGQGPLPPLVQLAVGSQGQGMGGDDHSPGKQGMQGLT